jgi:hypothetical protein
MQNLPKSAPESTNEHRSLRWPEHPYRGLNFFTAEDSLLFGEREEEIEDCFRLVSKLRTRMLLLHGRSGTGKSSFLRAGILPQLRDQEVVVTLPALGSKTGSLVIRCTSDPVARIAIILGELVRIGPIAERTTLESQREIKRLLTFEANELRTTLANRIVHALALITPNLDRPLLLVIDQGEEVLSLPVRQGINAREGFFWLLEELCWQTKIGLKIILALRTEYYGQFCDHFKLEPQTKISPGESGVQQYMLHGLSEIGRLSSAIMRPTRTEKIEGLCSPKEFYKFSFAEGLPDRIAKDLLAHCGESSTLPVMQIVCTQLFKRMRDRNDSIIGMGDYIQIGLVAGALDAFVDSGIKTSISDSGETPTEQNVRRWRETLGSLVAKQEGGAVTTLIVSKAKLVSIARDCGLRGAIGTIINNMARERCRLLRPVATITNGLFRTRREYSLGHDALAIALFRWAEAHEAIIETKRQTQRRIRWLEIAGLIIGAISCLALFQLVSQRAVTLATLLAFAQSDQTGSYGQRLGLLSASLDQAKLPIRLFLDYEKPVKAIRETLERAPLDGNEGEAVGFSSDGGSLALLSGDRVLVVPIDPAAILNSDKHSEFQFHDEVIFSQGEENFASSNVPIASAVGFVQGLLSPVVYKGGVLYYWLDRQQHSVSLRTLLPPLLLNSPLPQGIEISGGVIRVWLWRFGATDMDYILIRAASDRSQENIFVATPPMKVAWKSLLLPVSSLQSPEAAFIDREPDKTKPGRFQYLVKRIDYSEPSTELPKLLGTIDDSDREAEQRGESLGPAGEFVRSLAFPTNAGGIMTRSARNRFEYFSEAGPTSLTFQILKEMQNEPQRPAFFSLRPLLAAQQSVSDRTIWRFAWLGQNGIYVMESGGGDRRARPISWPPLVAGEFGIENARALTFNPDGTVLTLVTQRGFREKVKYRIYDLTDARRSKIAGMSIVALQSEACRVAWTEQSARSASNNRTLFRPFSCD